MDLITNRPIYSSRPLVLISRNAIYYLDRVPRVFHSTCFSHPVSIIRTKGYPMRKYSLCSSISNSVPTFKGQCLLWLRLTCFLPVLPLLRTWQYRSNCHRRSGGVRPRILASLSNLPNRLLPVISRSKPSAQATLQPHALTAIWLFPIELFRYQHRNFRSLLCKSMSEIPTTIDSKGAVFYNSPSITC
jgi:hypothetical protein